jgi:hypothetical protein
MDAKCVSLVEDTLRHSFAGMLAGEETETAGEGEVSPSVRSEDWWCCESGSSVCNVVTGEGVGGLWVVGL